VSPTSAEVSTTGLSPSPFRPGAAQRSATPAPKQSEPAYNPLFDDARDNSTPEPVINGSARGSAGITLSDVQLSGTIDAMLHASSTAAPAVQSRDAAVLAPYLQLLTSLLAKLSHADNATGGERAAAFALHDVSSLQQRISEAEAKLLALCAARAASQLQKPGHRRESFDLMRSLSSAGSQSNSPSHSGMASLTSVVTRLLDAHKRQLRTLERHAQADDASAAALPGASDRGAAAAELKGGWRKLKACAEDARGELRRLQEVSSQQESEVAIQWSEKQALQQHATAEVTRVQQARCAPLWPPVGNR
jgi:hypothetical protein